MILVAGVVFTTVEVVMGTAHGINFTREYDDATGYKELVVASSTTSTSDICSSSIDNKTNQQGQDKGQPYRVILLSLAAGASLGVYLSKYFHHRK